VSPEVRVVVVLNGVLDKDSYQFVYDLPIEVISIKKNLGYFKAVNLGMEAVPKGQNLVVINDDIEIKDPRWLSEMHHHMTKGVGIVGYRQELNLDKYLKRIPQDEPRLLKTDRYIISCALINHKLIESIGMFDGRYWCYWEDLGFIFRALSKGFKVRAIDKPYIFHEQRHTYDKMELVKDKRNMADARLFYEYWKGRYKAIENNNFPVSEIMKQVKSILINRREIKYGNANQKR
jgi:GT2 family glycosyltransferase